MVSEQGISIHKALASLDLYVNNFTNGNINFNPQGSREPRHRNGTKLIGTSGISIHKALASLDRMEYDESENDNISIHKALASLDV